jgi:hypothetical protein
MLVAGAAALAFGQWVVAAVAGVVVVVALPRDVADLRAALKGERAREPRRHLPLRLSRAQQHAAGMALIGGPVFAWRVFQDGWLAAAIIGPLVGIWLIWMVVLIRRDGWAAKKRTKH